MIFPFLIYSLQVYLGMIGRMINDINFWKSCKTQRYQASLTLMIVEPIFQLTDQANC